MNNWQKVFISDVAKVTVSNVDKIIDNNEKKVNLCNYMDVYRNNNIYSADGLSNGSVSSSEYDKFRLRKDQVIITKDSETPDDIARSSLVNCDIDNVVCGYHLAIITPKSDLLIGGYLKRIFDVPRYHNYFSRLANGVTRFGLTLPSIEKATIPLPPKPEQQRIVSVLETWDNYLELLDKKIALKEQLKKGLMQQLFNQKINYIGKNNDIYQNWSTKKLGELIIEKNKTRRQSSEGKKTGNYPFFDNSSKPCNRYLDEYDYNINAIISNTGGVAYFDHYNGKFATMADCFVFETKINSDFLYYLLKFIEKKIGHLAFAGSGIEHLDKKYFRKIPISFPSNIAEIEKIASTFTTIDEELTNLINKSQIIKSQKKYLLKNLITGTIRTPENLTIKEVVNA